MPAPVECCTSARGRCACTRALGALRTLAPVCNTMPAHARIRKSTLPTPTPTECYLCTRARERLCPYHGCSFRLVLFVRSVSNGVYCNRSAYTLMLQLHRDLRVPTVYKNTSIRKDEKRLKRKKREEFHTLKKGVTKRRRDHPEI